MCARAQLSCKLIWARFCAAAGRRRKRCCASTQQHPPPPPLTAPRCVFCTDAQRTANIRCCSTAPGVRQGVVASPALSAVACRCLPSPACTWFGSYPLTRQRGKLIKLRDAIITRTCRRRTHVACVYARSCTFCVRIEFPRRYGWRRADGRLSSTPPPPTSSLRCRTARNKDICFACAHHNHNHYIIAPRFGGEWVATATAATAVSCACQKPSVRGQACAGLELNRHRLAFRGYIRRGPRRADTDI